MAVEKFTAVVGASIREFQRKMREVDQTIRRTATEAEVEVGANTTEFTRRAREVNNEITQMQRRSVTISFGAIIRDFLARMGVVQAATNRLDGRVADVNVQADVTQFNLMMTYIRARIAALDGRTIWVNVRVNTARLLKDFKDTRNRITDAFRDMGEIVSQTISGALITLIPTLSPIISNLIGLIGSLGVMLGVVAGSTFAFATALVAAGAGAVAFGAVAIPTIKTLFDETAKLNAEQKVARKAFDDMKKTYDGLVKATESPVLQAFTNSMKVLDQILSDLEPLFVRSAEAVARMTEQLQTNINSKPIQDFFQFLNNFGGPLLETVGQSVGNLIKGLLSMMTAFGPLAVDTANGFLAMTRRFAEWAEGLKTSDSFNKFVDYVREHMPLVRAIFGDAFKGIIGFFTAFSGNASGFMKGLADMMARFREWSSTLGENQQFQNFLTYIKESAPAVLGLIGDLFNTLISLGKAFAPVGDFLIEKISAILQWFNAKIAEDGWFKSIVGWTPVILGSLMMLITPVAMIATLFRSKLVQSLLSVITPGTTVGGMLSKLGPIFTSLGGYIVKASGWFGTITGVVKNFIPWVTNLASKALPWLVRGFGLLTGPIGIAIAIITTLITFGIALYKNWDTVSTKAKELGQSVGKWFKNMGTTVTLIWESLKSAIPKIVDNMKKGISEKVEQIKSDTGKKFQAISDSAGKKVDEMKTAVKQKFVDMGRSVSEKITEMKTSITNGWNNSVKFLQGINLLQIGKDIINGLIKGISSKFGEVASKLSGLAEKIPSWVKTALKIKSPSRVMAAVGMWIPAGLAMGIDNNMNTLKKSVLHLSNAVAPNYKQVPKTTADMMNKIKGIVTNQNKATAAEVAKIEKEYAKKRNEATSSAERQIALIRQRGNESKKGITKSQLMQIQKLEADASSKQVKLSQEAAAKIQKIQSKNQSEALSKLETHAQNQTELELWTTKQLVEYWKFASTQFKAGTQERIKAQIQYKKATEQLVAEQFDKEKKYLDRAVKYQGMSYSQQLRVLQQYMNGHKKGSEEQIYYEEQIFETKKEIHQKLKALNDEMLSRVKETQQKQVDGEKELREAFAQTYKERKDQIKGFAGLFDEFKGTDMKDVDLVGNLEGQVDAMYEWMSNLDKLSVSGLSQGLIQEIQAMGVTAANEVRALTELTAEELMEYQNLWDMKNALADTRTGIEMTGDAGKLQQDIAQLNADTKNELDAIKKEFKTGMDEILYGPIESFDMFNASLPQIGKSAMEGFVEGMRSAETQVRKQAMNISNIVRESLQSISNLQANMQMSGNFGVDMGTMAPIVIQSVATPNIPEMEAPEDEPQPIIINVHQEWNGEDVLTYIEENQSRKYNIELYTKGDDW